jgi:hypothetical protein
MEVWPTPDQVAAMNEPVSEENPTPGWLFLGPRRTAEEVERFKASVLIAYGAGFNGSADWENDGYPDWFLDDDDPLWAVEPDAR